MSTNPARLPRALPASRANAKERGDPAAPGFRIEDSPFFQMNRTAGSYAFAMEQALRALDTDIPRWRVLMLAHERGPVSVGQIAENAVLKLSTATKVIQRLRDEGLLVLRRGRSDGRVTDVRTTAAGDAAVAIIRQVASTLYRRAFRDIDANDIQQLIRILSRIEKNLRSTA